METNNEQAAAMDRAGELPLERRVAERRAEPPALVTTMASTIVALKEQLAAADDLIAAFESMMIGCCDQSWAAYENGDGENVGKRIEAARAAYHGAEPASQLDAPAPPEVVVEQQQPVAWMVKFVRAGSTTKDRAVYWHYDAIPGEWLPPLGEPVALYASPAVPVAGHGWKPLMDSHWVNIVNHARCYENFDKEEAVHLAVKLTEAKLKELNAPAAPVAAGLPASDAILFDVWSRPISYMDTLQGRQTCRDDLWAITTAELKDLLRAPALPVVPEGWREAVAKLRNGLGQGGWGWGNQAETDVGNTVLDAVETALEALVAAPVLSVVPEGWKLVPVEPTRLMLNAIWGKSSQLDLPDAYAAMIAATPELSAGQPSDKPQDQSGCDSALHAEPASAETQTELSKELRRYADDRTDYASKMIRAAAIEIERLTAIAEPDTATQAPSESIDTQEFRDAFESLMAHDDFGYEELVALINSWHQRATQAAKPLTDAQIEAIWKSLDGYAITLVATDEASWIKSIRQAFARAIELHLKGE